MISITGPEAAAFQYDGTGRRTSRTISGVGTQFLSDTGDVVQELSAGTPVAQLLRTLSTDELLMRTDASGVRTVLSDSLGSAVAEVDVTTLASQYTYEPFGRTYRSGDPPTNSFQYTGRENDGNGLY